jgi:chromosome segregation ATPase
MEQNFNII